MSNETKPTGPAADEYVIKRSSAPQEHLHGLHNNETQVVATAFMTEAHAKVLNKNAENNKFPYFWKRIIS